MIIIKMNKELTRYEIEELGKLYKAQAEEGLIVLPKDTEYEEIKPERVMIQFPSIAVEEFKPTWRERLFGYKPLKPLEVEEVGTIDFNQPVKPKPPGN